MTQYSVCYHNRLMRFVVVILMCLALPDASGTEPSKILKVYILAGQSNMQGHAKIETLDYLRDDADSVDLYDKLVDENGQPREADQVWISYLTGSRDGNGEVHGILTAGYGARRNPSESAGKIGPEFTFGLRMDEALEQPVLIIKTAWGGKSLFHDFRPPSAGVYPRTQRDIERERYTNEDSGKYYRLMIEHVKSVLQEPQQVCPEYDPQAGYEIAGFVWFQGWNDLVNHEFYPRLPADSTENKYAKYTELLDWFISDVRRDLEAPRLPFVIGVMGVGGYQTEERYKRQHQQFRDAMAAPASNPTYDQSVVAIQTADFWDERLGTISNKLQQLRGKRSQLNRLVQSGELSEEEMAAELAKFERELISPDEKEAFERGASNAAYHYLGCGKTFALMGEAFANALLKQSAPR